jgi:hypothetical protein
MRIWVARAIVLALVAFTAAAWVAAWILILAYGGIFTR